MEEGSAAGVAKDVKAYRSEAALNGQAYSTYLDSNISLLYQVLVHLLVATCRFAGNVLR